MTVAEVDGVVVASAIGEVGDAIPAPGRPHGSLGLLSSVVTLPEHRGHGYASACVDAVLAWFEQSTSVERVDLFATSDGEGIYARRGFRMSDCPSMRWVPARLAR